MELEGQVAIVTGAASGIGRAMAMAFAAAGAAIVAADRDAPALQDLAAQLEGDGATILTVPTDISRSGEVDHCVAAALDRFGRVDHLLHCAGIAPQGPATQMSDETWRRGIAVNLDGAFYFARAAGRHMKEQRRGSMIFLASDRGVHGGARVADYAAAKGGMIALMKSLALELGEAGVTVNAINPGTTNTPLARGNLTAEQWAEKSKADPLGVFSEPEEIADLALFLVTKGSFITGQLVTTRMRAG